MRPTRYTYDCEFLDDGVKIDLISIGIVCVDDPGRQYYAVNRDVSWIEVINHPWLRTNVVPALPLKEETKDRAFPILDYDNVLVMSKEKIAEDVARFLTDDHDGTRRDDREARELWAYYAAYDHVCLAQLWGPMVNLPAGIPMFTRDIKDWAVRLGDPELPVQLEDTEHNAIKDAWHNVSMMNHLEYVERHLAI